MGGPLALLLGYLCMMAIVWNIMNDLAEIVVYLPLKGATIPYFVDRFVEPSLAFAAGWNYWYAYAILVAVCSPGPRASKRLQKDPTNKRRPRLQQAPLSWTTGRRLSRRQCGSPSSSP